MPIPLPKILKTLRTKTPFSAEEMAALDLSNIIMMLSSDLMFTMTLVAEHPALLDQCIQSKDDLVALSNAIALFVERQSNCLGDLGQAFRQRLRTNESQHGLDETYSGGVVTDDEIQGLITDKMYGLEGQFDQLFELIPHGESLFSGVDDFLAFIHSSKYFYVLTFSLQNIKAIVEADATFNAERLLGADEKYNKEISDLIRAVPGVMIGLLEAADPSILQDLSASEQAILDKLAQHQPGRVGALLAKVPATAEPPCP